MNRDTNKVNVKNLRRLCWQRGFHGVAGLARKLGRNRVTIYRAIEHPSRFGPAYKLIQEALVNE